MQPYKIDKPIRLIELFAGIGSQAMALRNLGANFTTYRTCEWWIQPNASYKAIHCADDTKDYSEKLSKEQIAERLSRYGISNNGKDPMAEDKIRKKPEWWLREVYNNIRATKNLVNIQNITGDDLGVVETDKYTYIVTYSFPCQDLSVAGKMAGMDKGSGTRSGMLWEVERLLDEMRELPQILLMENVPQVMQRKNLHNFEAWQEFLTGKGYKNFAKILNAKDFGIPQNRQRAYMVSILGDFDYEFPEEIPLEKTMDDLLEDKVDEKFYVNSEAADGLITELIQSGRLEKKVSKTIRGGRIQKLGALGGEHQGNLVFDSCGICRCLTATEYKHATKIIRTGKKEC